MQLQLIKSHAPCRTYTTRSNYFADNSRAWEAVDKGHVLEEIIRLITEYPFSPGARNEGTN